MLHQVIFVMGVSGSGKSTIGRLLSDELGYPFYDADDFHPAANISKMQAGHALTDADRWPWLDNIHQFVTAQLPTTSLIFACSALKASYRQRLCKNTQPQCRWVYLEGDFDTIHQRILQRSNHYMPAALLQSQFDALEIPADAIVANVCDRPEVMVEKIIQALSAGS